MTLTNRLTLFVLAALVAVLAAFSITFYVLAHNHLERQIEDRAAATLETLIAATEVEPDGLEWDRKERTLFLTPGAEPFRWAVFDSTGREVDAGTDFPLDGFAGAAPVAMPAKASRRGEPWRVYRRSHSHLRNDIVERKIVPGSVRVPGDERYQSLTFVVAVPLTPMQQTLAALARWLLGISLGIGILSALGSRWICRRALAPVAAMAEGARAITAANLDGRLPVPASRDELADLAGTFNDLLGRLQLAFERQKQFTGEASHQLRTPLTAMLGQIEVALRREREPDDYRRALLSAKVQADRLRAIVEMLLYLAQADAETNPPNLERINLARWLPAYLAETWSNHPRFTDLILPEAREVEISVLVQSQLLGQAVDNLVDNAFKYSEVGTSVGVQLARDYDEAIITVEDRGSGFSESDRLQLFTPFFRSADARRQGISGVGLGLSVTARIVRAFGGHITARGGPGTGSQFEIRLPRVREADPETG